jgi:hypothetical protein
MSVDIRNTYLILCKRDQTVEHVYTTTKERSTMVMLDIFNMNVERKYAYSRSMAFEVTPHQFRVHYK